MINHAKVGAIAREAGIKAALAAAGTADDDGSDECTCPKCGHTGPSEEFMASETGANNVDDNEDTDNNADEET